MKALKALEGGLAGALALTAVHEGVKKLVPGAPRMDLLGMTALSKVLENAKASVPNRKSLYWIALAGDVAANALYYSLAGVGGRKHALLRSAILGLAAGIGGVVVPKYTDLPERHSSRTTKTSAMTVSWYLIGGLVAGATMLALSQRKKRKYATSYSEPSQLNPAEVKMQGLVEP